LKNLFDTRLYFYSVGLIISSAIERFITFFLNDYFILNIIYYHLISLGILIILFNIVNNIFLKTFIHKEFVTKIISGKKYIGGQWLEITITNTNEISHITKMEISYENDKIKLHGNCYQNGKHIYNLDSVCTSLDNYNLTYVFVAYEKIPRTDYGTLLFEESGRKPVKYTGHYDDKGMEFKVAGILINDKSIIEKMKTNDNFVEIAEKDLLPQLIKMHKLNIIPDKNNINIYGG